MTGRADWPDRPGGGRTRDPHPRQQEDGIDALWPRQAPPTVKTAVLGLYVMVALFVANIVTVEAIAPSGGIVAEDVLIGAGFLAIVVGIGRRALWARYTGVAVGALFAIGAVSQFRSGVPGIVVVAGFVQLVVLVAVVVLLLLPVSGDWFRGLD